MNTENSSQNKNIYITGATGYIGGRLYDFLTKCGSYNVISIGRKKISPNKNYICIEDFNDKRLLEKIELTADAFIHVAGMAHKFEKKDYDYEVALSRANVGATLSLAYRAAELGVKRFIFISSISVYGEEASKKPLSEMITPRPISLYAKSKYEAELKLKDFCNKCAMELVIIRPPMVYGPSCPGNFSRLISLASKRIYLPLLKITNKRSFIAIENLINFIFVCINHPKAANQDFVIADDSSISTTHLIENIYKGLGIKPRLFYIPKLLAKMIFLIGARRNMYKQLFCSLEIDSSKAKKELEWKAVVSAENAIIEHTKSTKKASDD